MIAMRTAGHRLRWAALACAVCAAATLLACLFLACNGTQNPTLTSDTACAQYGTAVCEESLTCAPDVFYTTNASLSSCVVNQAWLCTARLEAPSTIDDSYRIQACAGVFSPDAGYACSDYLLDVAPFACVPLAGALTKGSACAFDAQCESAYCAVVKGGLCGVCAPPPVAGDSCAALDSCGGSLFCAASWACVVPGALGYPCDPSTAPCGAQLSCVAGTCVAEGYLAGAPCDAINGPGCASALGLYCTSAGTCANVTYAAAGEACGDDVGGAVVECGSGGACIDGACVAPATPLVDGGGACDLVKGPPCPSPWRCVDGACALPDARRCAALADAAAP